MCHSEGIRYVGQTSQNPWARLSAHLSMVKFRKDRGQRLSHVQNWIEKHGAENIFVATLEVCTVGELDDRESVWIDFFDNLVNIKPGGGQARGWKMPEDVVASRRGPRNPMYGKDRSELMDRIRPMRKPPSAENRKKKSEQLERLRKDPDFLQKQWEGNKRSHNTPEYLQYASERMRGEANPNYGKPWTEERRRKTQLGRLAAAGLTEHDIRTMRQMHASGMTNKEIAKLYGYSESGMSQITSRKKWAWVE